MAAQSHTDRFNGALSGAIVTPPVRGLTFVAPALLPGGAGAVDPATALVHACVRGGLDFAFVPTWEPWAARAVVELASAGVAALNVIPGVVWPALEAMGVEAGLRAAARDPRALADAMDSALAVALAAARAAVEGAVGIVVADDMAGSGGPLLPPALLEREAFPRLAQLVRVANAAGLAALLHSDGDVRGLFGPIRNAGFAGVHGDFGGSMPAPLVSLARASQLVLVGGIPTAALGTSVAAMDAARTVGALASGGGLLIADDGGVSTPEQAQALAAALAAAAIG